MLEKLRHPVRTFRTAPFAYIGNTVIASTGRINTVYGREASFTFVLETALVLSGIAAGMHQIKRQCALRDRLESAYAKHGYDNRLFSPTTQHWCDRQVVHTILEYEQGDMAMYRGLVSSNDDVEYAWLGHL